MKNLNKFKILAIGLLAIPLLSFAQDENLLPPEVLISPQDFYPAEEVLYLEGRAKPGALIEVQIEESGQELAVIPALAGNSGDWLVSQKLFLSSGDYNIRARQSL